MGRYGMPQTLKDRNGACIGFLRTDSNGDQTLTDRFGSYLGKYRAGTDTTVDRLGNVVGFGNLLMTLLR